MDEMKASLMTALLLEKVVDSGEGCSGVSAEGNSSVEEGSVSGVGEGEGGIGGEGESEGGSSRYSYRRR